MLICLFSRVEGANESNLFNRAATATVVVTTRGSKLGNQIVKYIKMCD